LQLLAVVLVQVIGGGVVHPRAIEGQAKGVVVVFLQDFGGRLYRAVAVEVAEGEPGITQMVFYAVLVQRIGPGGIGYAAFAVVHRFDDRVALRALAEFESVEVVLAVSDEVVGAHGFAVLWIE
jgi:hypothetical protein